MEEEEFHTVYDAESLITFKDNIVSREEEDEVLSEGAYLASLDDTAKLKHIQRRLGLVTLSWSPKKYDAQFKQLPQQYKSVSDHEKAFLWYAENFRKQYVAVYPERKPLLLTCANECDVQVNSCYNSFFFNFLLQLSFIV